MLNQASSDSLYNDQILALSKSLVKDDRLNAPDQTVTLDSPLCGSRVKVDVNYSPEEDRITAYGQEVRACALGQASAAIMAKYAIGSSAAEITEIREELEVMLKKGEPAPVDKWAQKWTGKWGELAALQPASANKSRHASILLPFKAVEKAIGAINAQVIA